MSFRLIIRKRAEGHLTKAYDWYEKQKPALGKDFLLSVDSILVLVAKTPLLFQVRHDKIRIALTPRFPYGIFYFVDKDKIVVVAVFHLGRDPKLWMK